MMSGPGGRVEHPGLRGYPAQRLAMMVADMNVGAKRLDLSELIRWDGLAIHAAADEKEVHWAPILYIYTIS
ncbi:hypothetical protein AB7M23_004088 [Pseudomonas sp. HLS-6 TE3448]